MSDILQRFHFVGSPVRGEICQLDEGYREILSRHAYPPALQRLLGEAVAATVLMASSLKFEGTLILQIQSEGALSLLMAECDDSGAFRGIARYDEEAVAALPEDAAWTALTGSGQLILTIDPDEGERYQGIVALEGETLARALDGYFARSEQLPTRFHLAADGRQAAGLLLQVLPGHDAGDDADVWPRVLNLAATLKPAELTGLAVEDVLYRLYHEEEVELFPASDLRFHCSCTRERSSNALRSLDDDELRELLVEHGGRIEVDCQFCRQRYVFDQIDIERILRGADEASPRLQ